MAYTFKRGCKVIIGFEGVCYVFDRVIDYSHSQNFDRQVVDLKTSRLRRTNPKVVVNKVNAGSFNLEVPLMYAEAIDVPEQVFFKMLPFDYGGSDHVFTLSKYLPDSPKTCNIAIVNNEEYYLLKSACVTSVDLSMSKRAPSIKVNFTFSKQEINQGKGILEGTTPNVLQAPYHKVTPIKFVYEGRIHPHILGVGMNIQQDIEWLDPRNAYNLSKLNYPTTPVLNGFSVGITADLYKKDTDLKNEPHHGIVSFKQSSTEVLVTNAMVIPNIQADTIYKRNLDISIDENTELKVKLGNFYV